MPFSGARRQSDAFEAPTLDRRWNSQRLAIFRDRATSNIDAVAFQPFHDLVVGQDVAGGLRIDHLANAVADGFRGMEVPLACGRDRRGEEVF